MTYEQAVIKRDAYLHLLGKLFKGKQIEIMLIVDKEQSQLSSLIGLYHRSGISEVSQYVHQDYDIVVLLEYPGQLLDGYMEKITLDDLLSQVTD